jgi:hypothetical protein
VPVTNDQIVELEKQLVQIKIEYWLKEDLFSPQWWLMLAVLVIPWIIWWKYVDRSRILPITLLGMFILILSSYLDAIGSELTLWQYNKMLLPLWSRLISVDFSVMPVTYMFIYQNFTKWRTFSVASVALALLFAFLAEPIVAWLGIYQPNAWSHWYSFVIYILLAFFTRMIVEKIVTRSNSNE